MNAKRLWATTAATLFALSAVGPHSSGVWAQLSDTAACPTGWEWNQNSLGQDPCTIGSQLDAACRGLGSYTVPALNSSQNYVPPQKDSTADLTCDCDTVMYSLYMACTTCQGGIIYSWPKWIAQCETVYVTQYPHNVPYGTAIPHWAFYDVTTLPNQTYSDTVATSVGRNPEATPKPLSTIGPSSTHSGSKSSSSSSSGSNPTNTSTNNDSGSHIPLAAIIGGAVGGVVLIAASIFGAILISRRKKSGGSHQPPLQPLSSQETVEYQKVQPMSPMPSPGGNPPYNGPPPMGMPYNGPQGMPYNAPPPQDMPYNAPPPQDMPYNPATGPTLPYNNPTGPGLPFNGSPPPNLPYNAPPAQNPPAAYYNPEDPTTFPPPMGDGQSSVTYTNSSTGPNRYGGMPEL